MHEFNKHTIQLHTVISHSSFHNRHLRRVHSTAPPPLLPSPRPHHIRLLSITILKICQWIQAYFKARLDYIVLTVNINNFVFVFLFVRFLFHQNIVCYCLWKRSQVVENYCILMWYESSRHYWMLLFVCANYSFPNYWLTYYLCNIDCFVRWWALGQYKAT